MMTGMFWANGVRAGKHVAEVVGADCDHGREADRRFHGVAPADPIPEAEHIGGVDAKFAYSIGVGGNCDKVFGYGLLIAKGVDQPCAGTVGVGHGFEGCKGFGRDDEQGFSGVEIAGCFGEVGAINVGDKAEGEFALAVMAQGLVGHYWAKVGATNADIDDVADAFAGVAEPLAAADAVGEIAHGVEYGVYFGYDVYAIDDDFGIAWCAQGGVQYGAVLSDVDFLTGEHGFDPLGKVGLLGELE
jgi:hypothetical protein